MVLFVGLGVGGQPAESAREINIYIYINIYEIIIIIISVRFDSI